MEEYYASRDIFDDKGVLLVRKSQIIKEATAYKLRNHKITLNSVSSNENKKKLTVEPIKDLFIQQYNIQDLKMVDSSSKFLEGIIFDRNMPWHFHIKLLSNHVDWIYVHAIHTSLISILIGYKLNYTDQQLYDLALGALFHDIGMLLVPEEILNRRNNHNNTDVYIMKQHCVLGVSSMKSFQLTEESLDIILHHHERLDGSGYPHGLAGDEISQLCKIIIIADTIDTIASGLTQTRSEPLDAAINLIKNDSTKYPQDILSVFTSLLRPESDIYI